MNNIKISLPDLKYKESFLAAVKEYRTFGDSDYDKYDDEMTDEEFLNKVVTPSLQGMKAINLPEGYVPYTNFWIVDENGFAGRVDFRHSLTDALLKVGGHIGYGVVPSKRGRGYIKEALQLVLFEVKEFGLNEVLITCDEDNEASRRTILGVLKEFGGREDEPYYGEDGKKTLRFWVKTSRYSCG